MLNLDGPIRGSVDCGTNRCKARSDGMRVLREHRLDPMPNDVGQIRVINPDTSHMGNVAVAALVGANV